MIFVNNRTKKTVAHILDKNREVRPMPKAFNLIACLYALILFVPESLWIHLGVDAFSYLDRVPKFLNYYVQNTQFHHSMFVFWVSGLFVLPINTALFLRKINVLEYESHLQTRRGLIQQNRKSWLPTLLISVLVFLLAYAWAVLLNYDEFPLINKVAITSKFGMLLHWGWLSFVLPIMLTLIFTEIRIFLTRKDA